MDYDQQVYPYERHPEDAHEMAWLFFNVPDTPRFQLEVADKMVRHLEALGVDLTVGATKAPEKKYDAVGSPVARGRQACGSTGMRTAHRSSPPPRTRTSPA